MKKLLIALFVPVLLLSACATQAPAWHTITAEQARAIMADTDGFLLLDVRTAAEFQQARLHGATLIPYDEIQRRADELPGRDTVVLIYCRTGRRSAIAAAALVELGFSAIYDFGGIYDWPFERIEGG